MGSFHHSGNLEISEWWIKTRKRLKQFCMSFLRLNLGELVVEGLGLFILVLKFGWKLVIFSKRGGYQRNNLFPYLWDDGRCLLSGAKVEGSFSSLFALLLDRIISLYIQCLCLLYFYCSIVGIYNIFFLRKLYLDF